MKQKYLFLSSLIGFLISSDQFIKAVVTRYFLDGSAQFLNAAIEIGPVHNNGLIYNLINRAPASLQDTVYIGIPMIALILIVLIFIKLQNNQMMATVALTLILGGAISNLLDRIQFNSIMDIVRVNFLGTHSFNLADIYILAGMVLMLITTLRREKISQTI